MRHPRWWPCVIACVLAMGARVPAQHAPAEAGKADGPVVPKPATPPHEANGSAKASEKPTPQGADTKPGATPGTAENKTGEKSAVTPAEGTSSKAHGEPAASSRTKPRVPPPTKNSPDVRAVVERIQKRIDTELGPGHAQKPAARPTTARSSAGEPASGALQPLPHRVRLTWRVELAWPDELARGPEPATPPVPVVWP